MKTLTPMEIEVFDNAEALCHAAAQSFIAAYKEGVARGNDRFSWVLSGGSTPKNTYKLLSQPHYQEQVDWQKVHIFWGDERCVPTDDENSNQYMTDEALLNHIPIPAQNIHRLSYQQNPDAMADAFEADLKAFFGSTAPVFDYVYLGLGDNGHTASLFPETPVLDETQRWVRSVHIPGQEFAENRITLTAPILNQAKKLVFLVSGEAKAEVLSQVIYGPAQPSHLPAQLVRPVNGELIWLVDKAASIELKN